MEIYRKKIRSRLRWLIGLLVSMLIVVRVLLFIPTYGVQIDFIDNTLHESSLSVQLFISGFFTGMFLALVGAFLFQIVRCALALRNETRLRKLYIQEHDERSKAIRNHIGGSGYTIIMVFVTVGGYVSGVLNQVAVSVTLLAVLALMALTKAALKAYYHNRI